MRKIFCLAFYMFIVCVVSAQNSEARLMRFPAIFDNQVVFSYAGNLYIANIDNGQARMLTSDDGFESFPRFSPDGTQIAFTGQYDGNTEVFVIPASGGEPRRITYTATLNRDDIADRMGPNNITLTWKDNETIVFRSRKNSFNSFKGQLFLANINGGLPMPVPISEGGFCSFSPDGKKLAFNRVFREFRTWKYYQGGMADDIWIYDFESQQVLNVTNNPAQDVFPMWYGNTIYFLSDRDRTMNLFAYNIDEKSTKKITTFDDYDIKFPSIGNNAIVFEKGGYLFKYDLKEKKIKKLRIFIENDFPWARKFQADAADLITDISLSPDGARLAVNGRGDVFSVPSSEGVTYNFTNTSNVHERDVRWSPDGKNMAFISDLSGENEIYLIKNESGAQPVQITNNSDTYKYQIEWSPDGKKILWSDKKLRLLFIDIETKKVTQVDQAEVWEFSDYAWSPDSKWIAFSRPEKDSENKIFIYSIEQQQKYPITEGWYESSSPVFSNCGKYLFFCSRRDFNPIYSQTEWNHAYTDMERIYLVTLTRDLTSPLLPDNSVVDLSDTDKETTEKLPEVKIDFEHIAGRVEALPIEPSNYFNVSVVNDVVFYMKRSHNDDIAELKAFDLKKKNEVSIGDYSTYQISANHKKILLKKGKKYYVTDVPKISSKKTTLKIDTESETEIDFTGMKVWIDREAEWAQIFYESWRQMRDFFYDPNMHGVDWLAMKKKYEVLLPYVKHRNDLTYIIGEMIGEINVGHAYVGGGDRPEPKRIKTGLLGAQLSAHESGFFIIDKILDGENWSKNLRSPLTEPGFNIQEGDFLLAINGKSLKNVDNPYVLLLGQAEKQTEITVNEKPQMQGSRKLNITPIADEAGLYYFNWVRQNIKKVDEATNGQVGYIHIPNMGVEGLNEFVKYFYPQLRKRALIIDDRGNGGGNVSPMIAERLGRKLVMMRISRNTVPGTDPREMMYGPMVCLIDRYSASDGDIFPYRFKKMNLGKVIGVRSWGGVCGIRGSLPFIDGGSLFKPEFSIYQADGKSFIIEGYGVDPDIVIDNDPAAEFSGVDQQLDKAIEVILKELDSWPDELPAVPDYPDKTK